MYARRVQCLMPSGWFVLHLLTLTCLKNINDSNDSLNDYIYKVSHTCMHNRGFSLVHHRSQHLKCFTLNNLINFSIFLYTLHQWFIYYLCMVQINVLVPWKTPTEFTANDTKWYMTVSLQSQAPTLIYYCKSFSNKRFPCAKFYLETFT